MYVNDIAGKGWCEYNCCITVCHMSLSNMWNSCHISTFIKHYPTPVFRYPVILSIENHCSIQQQKKIAQHLREIFGDKLDVEEAFSKDPKQLPSPNSLRGKILIKVKHFCGFMAFFIPLLICCFSSLHRLCFFYLSLVSVLTLLIFPHSVTSLYIHPLFFPLSLLYHLCSFLIVFSL